MICIPHTKIAGVYYLKGLSLLRKLKRYHSNPEDALRMLSEYVSYAEPGQWGNGQISDQERDELIRWVVRFKDLPGPIVEIGTLLGYSVQAICEGVMQSGVRKRIYTVDSYGWNPMGIQPYRHRMLTHLNLVMAKRLTDLVVIDSTAEDFYKGFKEIPSFVFIDANHTYEFVKQDLQFFKDIGSPVIAGHDYDFPDVHRAVHEVLGENGLEVFSGTLFLWTRP